MSVNGTLVQFNTYNRQAANYTLVLTDAGKIVEMNVATANILTVPTNASVAFPVGTEIIIMQYGAGQTTIAGAGVTFRSKNDGRIIGARYTGVVCLKIATDEWYVVGNVST
jgi:hypothetical protein